MIQLEWADRARDQLADIWVAASPWNENSSKS